MTTSSPGRAVDAGTLNALTSSYAGLTKAGEDSVRAAWRFGQCVASFTDPQIGYRMHELADAMDLSSGTLYRYLRLFQAYQRPELAIQASRELETYNIDLLWRLKDDHYPVPHGKPLRGRHWQNKCRTCGGHDVGRIEVDASGNPLVSDEDLETIVNGPKPEQAAVPAAQFTSPPDAG